MNISSLKYHSVAKRMLWMQLDEVFSCTASTQWAINILVIWPTCTESLPSVGTDTQTVGE